VLTLAAICVSSSALCGEQAPNDISRYRQVLKKCGGIEVSLAAQPANTWIEQADAMKEHTALHFALGEAMPHADSMVLIHALGGHLCTTEYSIVLERQSNNRWTGTAVGRNQIWIKDAPYSSLPRKQWTLSEKSGRRIDTILQSVCLYAEPSQFVSEQNGPPPLGAMMQHLDVLTPTRRRSSDFFGGDAKGLTAELANLATPAD